MCHLGHFLGEVFCQFANIGTLVPVFGETDHFAILFSEAQPDRTAEGCHLIAGVVDIILTLHGIPCGLENRRHGISDRRTATVTDMQGAGGVGADEFNLDTLALACGGGSIGLSPAHDVIKNFVPAGRGQVEIDKSRAGDFNLLQERTRPEFRDQGLGDLARGLFFSPGHGHGEVRGKITMLRVAGYFDLDIRDNPGMEGVVGKTGLQRSADFPP